MSRNAEIERLEKEVERLKKAWGAEHKDAEAFAKQIVKEKERSRKIGQEVDTAIRALVRINERSGRGRLWHDCKEAVDVGLLLARKVYRDCKGYDPTDWEVNEYRTYLLDLLGTFTRE